MNDDFVAVKLIQLEKMTARQDKMAHLSQGRLNVAGLRLLYRKEFLDLLDKADGSKLVVWDKSLTGTFGFITDFSLLKEHGVTKMFIVETEGRIASCPKDCRSVFFVLRPQLDVIDAIANYIKIELQRGGGSRDYYLVLTPYKTLTCEERLKEKGVLSKLKQVTEFGFDLLPLDNDLLSMEESEFHSAYTLRRGDMLSALHRLARGLMSIQALHGIIPNIHGKGHAAKQLCDNLLRMRLETDLDQPPLAPAIDTLVLMDRNVDPLTPLLTQLTYEGLLDELIGINSASIRYQESRGGEEKTTQLNSGDELFAELRDRNFNTVGSLISRRAQLVSAQIKEKDNITTVAQVKDFVSKLPHMQLAKAQLATHISLADLVKSAVDDDDFLANLHCQQDFCQGLNTDTAEPYIEAALAREADLTQVLRLMCIQSYCNGGLKPRLLEYYRREILQVSCFLFVLLQSHYYLSNPTN